MRLRDIFRKRIRGGEIGPDEIFLDAANLPEFDNQQFEGRLERPISKLAMTLLGTSFFLAVLILGTKTWYLEVYAGQENADRSYNNSLRHLPVYAPRGVIKDRNGEVLASGSPDRDYIDYPGFSLLLGYVSYPNQSEIDAFGYGREEYVGRVGVEARWNEKLRGTPGIKIAEIDVSGEIQTENVFRSPIPGENIELSIDADVQRKLYEYIVELSRQHGYTGGAGVVMDIKTGEVIALTSFPEFDSGVMSYGDDTKKISGYITSPDKPFLNRAISGVYTPGSIVKPYVALGALTEKVITPEKKILSTGSISITSPYDKNVKYVFTDYKPQGWVDMRHAISVSSNIYFYEIGGGFENQKGIGIENIEKYARMFGLGEKTMIDIDGEATGTVPNPKWKEENFNGDIWRVGDTYNTVIGQYGFQVTAIQMARAVAGIATEGILVQPTILKKKDSGSVITKMTQVDPSAYKVVKEGMLLSVREGTSAALNIPGITVGAKTGSAELGISKQYVNSWVEGFFPFDNPKYSFAIVTEKGARSNTVGAVYAARQLLDWMRVYKPKYFQ